VIAEKFEIGDWSFERARLPAAPHIVFNALRHGREAVPFQNSDARSFPQPRIGVQAIFFP
jgi:hypothetical protein